ncbi:OsmC family protein [Chitinimonas arctica]|uniref:OsmC family protein n=1 Tax=Chitinimonas arctica TaxID=2594795 RepID=A0A516SJY7_9NEIS|nr:OsmC family protein [Chitinimonas arctica]QDQ28443.1 OsmC family protein [Chitinimonas arctica]
MSVTARKAEHGHFLTRLQAGEAAWLADAGPENGGLASAPDPHQLLNAALAACTAITVRMYAERKSIALLDVQVNIEHVEEGGVYRIQQQITLQGDLSLEQRAKLIEIAGKCPIHKALTGRFEIATEAL